jgi:hypothetical protein
MKTSEVKILLQKYYDGVTSVTEESMLEEYLLSSVCEAEFEADRLHFEALASMRNEEIEVPDDLEASVLHTLALVRKKAVPARRRILYVSFSIAAGLLLMVSTFVLLSRHDQTTYTSDPDLAYAQSREALELVSKYFNQGTAQLSELNKLNQAMEPLNRLNSLDKAARSLSEFGKLQNEK